MHPTTVLVVEDSATLRAALRLALEHVGFHVVEAENGRLALDAARRHLPDVVLLDLTTPVLDGWQSIRALRRDFRTEGIPVIAMTAREEIEAEVAEAGFDVHFRMPFTLTQLVGGIRRCLGGAATAAKGSPYDDGCPSPRAA